MEQLMREPQYNHAGIPNTLVHELGKANKIDSYAQFERCLREMGSRVHLFAVPLNFYGDQFVVQYPKGLEKDSEPEHAIYIVVNGAEEAQQMRQQLAVTSEENLRRLETTGSLTLPEEASREGIHPVEVAPIATEEE